MKTNSHFKYIGIDPGKSGGITMIHDNNFKKLWSLDNLRPLCKHENMKKFNKIIHSGENEEKRT